MPLPTARKRFGQHFLEDQTVLDEMLNSIAPKANDHLVEIGPGQGALTHYLIDQSQHFDAIEIDRDLVRHLKTLFADKPYFKLHEADALSFDFRTLRLDKQKLRIVGNLPYNISTPLLFHVFDQLDCIQDLHFLLQKEVVDRLCAAPHSADYGRLSIMAQYYCTNLKLFEVGPEAFDPPPAVTSAFIRMLPRSHSELQALKVQHLSLIVREAFNQRRKTLANALKHLISSAELLELNIDPKRRPQELSVAEFVALSNHYSKQHAKVAKPD